MKITDDQINELNQLIRKSKLDLPPQRKEVRRETQTYYWLQQNILDRNLEKVKKTPRLIELLDINIPEDNMINI